MAQLFYSAEQARQADLARMRQESQRLCGQSPESIARELDRRCPYCGELLIPRVEAWEVLGRRRQTIIYPDRHGCAREQAALAGAALARTAEAEARRRQAGQNRLHQAGLAGWLAGATFDAFAARAGWPGAESCKRRVMAYLAALAGPPDPGRPNWLILYGHYGTGKTHLAAAAVRAMVDRGGNRCYFRTWTDYLLRLQASWQPGDADEKTETEAGIIAELQEGDLVVIDDLDKRRPTPWTRSILFSVLNHRYDARLPTILTLNYGPGAVDPAQPGRLALETYLGGAVLDRLIAAAYDVIEFNGPSYRSGVAWGMPTGK